MNGSASFEKLYLMENIESSVKKRVGFINLNCTLSRQSLYLSFQFQTCFN